MKVVLFSRYPVDSNHPKGGVESVAVVLAKALARLDDLDVHLVTLERERTRIVVEQDGDVKVHRLSGSHWPQILDIHFGPGRRRLVKYMTDLKPDILHIHETYGLALGNLAIPYVFTIHGFDHANLTANSAKLACIRSRLWKFAERRGLAAQRYIISITPYVRRMVESLTRARIYDIDNPVDIRYFEVTRCPKPGRILCVGWINERKNTLGSIEAFARVADNYMEAKLIIAGHSQRAEYFNRVKQSIERHGISHKVAILGHISRGLLEQELARASVFLLPSRQENSPMAIAEAMAAGIPVIVSNRCGMPYMVEEGETGFLIDPESTEQIADRLARLLSSDRLCRKMGEAGRQVALRRFDPHIVAKKTRDVYRQVCGK